MRRTPLNLILVLALAASMSGCLSSSPPARFYTLHAGEPTDLAGSLAIGNDWVGIGPIGLPAYLDRPQIVTRAQGHRLVVHEFDRWADPLKGRVMKVLMEDLASLSESKRVVLYPWPSAFRPDRRVMGEIDAFESGPDGEVLLRVRWMLQDPGGSPVGEVHTGEYRESATPGDFDAIVAAMSRALARWSRDVATALAAWSEPGKS